MRCISRGICFVACVSALCAGTVSAQMIEVQSLDHAGHLTWTNDTTNIWCTVEWASSLNSAWHDTWSSLKHVFITNYVTTVDVPIFYKVYCTSNPVPPGERLYTGSTLTNWEVSLGDALFAQATEPPVTNGDIETVHFPTYSEVRANIHKRGIMAHNITFKRFIDDDAFDYIHTCSYDFRLPYLPSQANVGTNAQTMEIAFFIWDGGDTRLDYGMAIQWILNPWMEQFGDLRAWSDEGGGAWGYVGYLQPDTNWHTVKLAFDVRRQTTGLIVDTNHYPCRYSAIPKPESWGTETAARVCAEVVSLDPGESNPGALHRAQFKNWRWHWEPYDGPCDPSPLTCMQAEPPADNDEDGTQSEEAIEHDMARALTSTPTSEVTTEEQAVDEPTLRPPPRSRKHQNRKRMGKSKRKR